MTGWKKWRKKPRSSGKKNEIKLIDLGIIFIIIFTILFSLN